MEQITLIKEFLKKNSVTDIKIDEYDQTKINEIGQILTGKIQESYEDGILSNYAGLFCEYEKDDMGLAIKYFKMSAEKNNAYGLLNIATYYYNNDDHDQAEKYYKILADNGNVLGYYNLGELYKQQEKTELAITNLLQAIKGGHEASLTYLQSFVSAVRLYYLLVNMQQNKNIELEVNRLRKINQVRYFINKQQFLSKVSDCPVCLETKQTIPRECTHYYCIDCFVQLKKCAICE